MDSPAFNLNSMQFDPGDPITRDRFTIPSYVFAISFATPYSYS